MTSKILLLDHHKMTKESISQLLPNAEVRVVSTAAKALTFADEYAPDIIIMELSLAGHSGFEFLYEFRTYKDWESIPVIVYSNVHLHEAILQSRAWKELRVNAYLYKPEVSLQFVKEQVALALTTRHATVL